MLCPKQPPHPALVKYVPVTSDVIRTSFPKSLLHVILDFCLVYLDLACYQILILHRSPLDLFAYFRLPFLLSFDLCLPHNHNHNPISLLYLWIFA